MGQRRPHRQKRESQAKPALLHRLGRFGAALALAVQLLLPVIAMPPAALAAAGGAMTPAAAMLDQAAAVWGPAALCEPGSSMPSHHGKQGPLLVHPCPICWAVQQAASLLPPSLPPLPLVSAPVWLKAALPEDDPALRRNLSPAQPRGPPLV